MYQRTPQSFQYQSRLCVSILHSRQSTDQLVSLTGPTERQRRCGTSSRIFRLTTVLAEDDLCSLSGCEPATHDEPLTAVGVAPRRLRRGERVAAASVSATCNRNGSCHRRAEWIRPVNSTETPPTCSSSCRLRPLWQQAQHRDGQRWSLWSTWCGAGSQRPAKGHGQRRADVGAHGWPGQAAGSQTLTRRVGRTGRNMAVWWW